MAAAGLSGREIVIFEGDAGAHLAITTVEAGFQPASNGRILASSPIATGGRDAALLEKAGQAAFDSQCIPTRPDLLRVEGYKDFLAERRKEISRRLNEFLGTGTNPGVPSFASS